jgi:dihydrofolate synthase/folylpolyglutamate synthase
MQTAKEAVQWIRSLKTFGFKPGNDRMIWMLERLKHPERRLKFVHIAGTNGKGSNVAFLSTVLQSCGYEVGTYISPHVTTYLSRISLNGKEIDEASLVDICNRLKPLAEELAETPLGSPTEFEILTMAAILYFANYSYPDIVIWETGLGGRFDSTNVVHPILSMITNVGLDHIHILGDTIEKIAWDKAGIIKSGVPVITAVEDEGAFKVIEEIAREKRTKVYRLGRDFAIENEKMNQEDQSFTFVGPFRRYEEIHLGLKGVHQFKNAATSMMALELLRQYFAFLIDEEPLREGMLKAINPGRLEVVSREPLVVMDGAHNPHGTKVIAESVPRLFQYKNCVLILSIMQDKLMDEMLDHLLPLADQVVVTRAKTPRAAQPTKLAEKIMSKNPQVSIYIEEEPIDAVKKALSLAKAEDLVLVAGSLYLIESIRADLPTLWSRVGEM